jgi:hypothetical protein
MYVSGTEGQLRSSERQEIYSVARRVDRGDAGGTVPAKGKRRRGADSAGERARCPESISRIEIIYI